MRTLTLLSVLSVAASVLAAEGPTALELVFHDAVRYQPMDVQSAVAHRKDPAVALKPAVDKDGKPAPVVVQPLHVYVTLEQPAGKVVLARAAQEVRIGRKGGVRPWSNFAVHSVDASTVQWRDRRLAGTLIATVNPDMTHHYQRIPAECRLEFDVGPGQEGKYQGRYGGYGVDGKVTCEVVRPPDLSKPCETTLMINNALNLPGIGPNAPRGCLNASWQDGKPVTAHLGDTYGYNLWLATVDAGGLILRDAKLTGKLIGHVASTYQDKYAGECEWTIDAVVIGRRVLGNGTGKKTGSKGKTEEFAIAINGLVGNTTDVPDVRAWWLDSDQRARQAAGDESYWHGRNPHKAKPSTDPSKKLLGGTP
jgi:hypothetical protein